MDENSSSEAVPDLKDIEGKIGRKTPEGLLRWMREEATSLRGDAKLTIAHDASKETGKRSLDEKIRKLKIEMAHLRSVDVKILQQLLAVHEGIEAVKWLMEERSTLTSRCSSLTSSQYSLGEGPDTSWRGSWSSLQDPNDKLDNISIGSYLDTLADEMDEYCPSSSDSVICSSTPQVSEATVGGRTVGAAGTGVAAKSGAKVIENNAGLGNGVTTAVTGNSETVIGKPITPMTSPQTKIEGPKRDMSPVWCNAPDAAKGSPISNDKPQTQVIKANGVVDKSATQKGSPRHSSQSPKLKPYTNGKIDTDTTCKMNGKMHLEYDAHWRWVQSQEDVTFL